MIDIVITEHAKIRAKERLGIDAKSLTRMAVIAYKNGIHHKDTKGNFNKYLTSLYFYEKTANNMRVYGEHIYIFSGNVLVTILRVPVKYKKHIKNNK